HRRHRDQFGEVHELLQRQELLGDPLLAHQVGLGDDAQHRGAAGDPGQLLGDEPVTRTDLLVRRHAEADDVHFRPRLVDQVVEPPAEQGARPVQPGRVHDDQLRVRAVHDAADGVPGGLGFAGGDRHLRTDQTVRQRRLAAVRSPDEAGETGAVDVLGAGHHTIVTSSAVSRAPGVRGVLAHWTTTPTTSPLALDRSTGALLPKSRTAATEALPTWSASVHTAAASSPSAPLATAAAMAACSAVSCSDGNVTLHAA